MSTSLLMATATAIATGKIFTCGQLDQDDKVLYSGGLTDEGRGNAGTLKTYTVSFTPSDLY